MAEEDDEQVLIDCLRDIREGIITEDWQVVADAYNTITGEEIEVRKQVLPKKTKLQKIRESFSSKKDEQKSEESVPIPVAKGRVPKEDDEKQQTVELKKKNKEGKFAKGEMTIISSPVYEKEKKKNEKIRDSTPRTRRPEFKEKELGCDDEGVSVTFFNGKKPKKSDRPRD